MADTPVWRWPRTTAQGQYVGPDDLVMLSWAPYSGAGNLDHIQVQIGTVSGLASGVLLDTGLREPDGVFLYDGGAEIHLSRLPAESGDTLYIQVRVESDAPATSSWSAEATIETLSPPTFTRWRQGA